MTEEPDSRETSTEGSGWPHGPGPGTHVALDAKGLRALAHPVRVQLLGLLRTWGPSTATRLAERTGLTSGATSYHLRQLAAAGFVVEDAERGNARDRWWKAAHQTTWWSDRGLAEEEPEATLAYLQAVIATNTRAAQQTLSAYQTMPRQWQDVFELSDWSLRLTPEEAHRLTSELFAVVDRYRRYLPEESADAVDDSTRVALVVQLLPDPEITAGGTDEQTESNSGDRVRRDHEGER